MTRQDILKIIEKDSWMMEVINTVNKLNLPDWWIGAGFVRSKVWDYLHDYKTPTPLPDVDVIYFDPNDFAKSETHSESTKMEKKYEAELEKAIQGVEWSVTNQARMHVFHDCPPYKNCEDALRDWVETATCIAVRLNDKNELELIAPWGVFDLTNLILRHANKSPERIKEFYRRIEEKKWLEKWPKLKIVND